MPQDEALSSLIAALRIPHDEVRFNVALATACTLDLTNGASLARAALESAATDPDAGARAESVLAGVPPRLRCSDQVATNALTLGVGRARGKTGSIDLVLRDLHGFALALELKIGRRTYDHGQIERYLDTGLPVIGLAPKRRQHLQTVTAHPGWLGEALWRDLVDVLRDFRLPHEARTTWRALVEIVIEDGDFGSVPDREPRRREQEARAVLERIAADMGAPSAPISWHSADRLWVLEIPDSNEPAGGVAIDLDDPVPFVAVVGTHSRNGAQLVREFGAVLDADGVAAGVALTLEERRNPVELVPGVLRPVVERFLEVGAIAV